MEKLMISILIFATSCAVGNFENQEENYLNNEMISKIDKLTQRIIELENKEDPNLENRIEKLEQLAKIGILRSCQGSID